MSLVRYDVTHDRFLAKIRIDKKDVHIGSYFNREDAEAAYAACKASPDPIKWIRENRTSRRPGRSWRVQETVVDGVTVSKVCFRCRIDKPIAEFLFLRAAGRYESSCKSCLSLYRSEYYKKNKEYVDWSTDKWRAGNPEKVLRKQKTYLQRRRERLGIKTREEALEARRAEMRKKMDYLLSIKDQIGEFSWTNLRKAEETGLVNFCATKLVRLHFPEYYVFVRGHPGTETEKARMERSNQKRRAKLDLLLSKKDQIGEFNWLNLRKAYHSGIIPFEATNFLPLHFPEYYVYMRKKRRGDKIKRPALFVDIQ